MTTYTLPAALLTAPQQTSYSQRALTHLLHDLARQEAQRRTFDLACEVVRAQNALAQASLSLRLARLEAHTLPRFSDAKREAQERVRRQRAEVERLRRAMLGAQRRWDETQNTRNERTLTENTESEKHEEGAACG